MPASFPRKFFILVVLLLDAGMFPALAAGDLPPAAPVSNEPLQPKHVDWSFEGPLGTYDRASLQRGFKIYIDACSSCHALSHVSFRDLGGPGGLGFSPAEVAAIAARYKVPSESDPQGKNGDASGAPLMRLATPADNFPPPFPNEQAMRRAMNGALPPDLSLIVSTRPGHSDYIYSIITGFGQKPPAHQKIAPGLHYNPYFPGHQIAMPPPLTDGAVSYGDGTMSTVDQEARDVVTFLAWASDLKTGEHKSVILGVILCLILFMGLLYFSFRHIWRPWH